MKKARKVFTLIMVVVMVLSMSITAMAADITITGGANDAEYAAYRILNATDGGDGKFAYTLNDDYKEILKTETNGLTEVEDIITYIRNLTPEELQNFASDVYAAIVAASLPADGNSDATDKNIIKNVEQGYYLIAETQTGTWPDGSEDAVSFVMLDTAGNDSIEVATKEERPTLVKKINDDNNAIEDGSGNDIDIAEDGKSNNMSIGSMIQYTLTATIPDNAAQYDYYYCIFSDKLSEGLTFITTGAEELTVTATGAIDPTYQLYTGADAGDVANYAGGNTFQVALTNAKALAGQTVTVTYWAKLNENAVVGETDGNSNDAVLTYSNDPNTQYGDTQGNETPGKPDSAQDVPTGDTPHQETVTYTTGIKILKTDGTNSLAGAEFCITGDNVVVTMVSKDVYTEDVAGTYYLLADGITYTNQAPQENDEYVEAELGATAGWVNMGTQGEPNWVEYDEDNDDHSGKQIYILKKENTDLYENPIKKYIKTTEFEQIEKDNTGINVKAFVDADGILYFNGLGEGTYTIEETTVPAGYNKIENLTVTIEWDETDGFSAEVTSAGGNSDLLLADGEEVYELTVVNQSGTELPSTGGMGTTVFYLVGGALVLIAVVLLITKKRMSTEE